MMHPPSKNGDRITGSIKPFQIRDFKKEYNNLTTGIPSFPHAYQFRLIVKQLSADRMRLAMRSCNMYCQLPRNQIISILHESNVDDDIFRYVICLIDYYNDALFCNYHVIPEKCCKSSQRISTIKHSIRDVEALISGPIAVVIKRLTATKSLGNDQEVALGKYHTILSATKIFLDILRQMYLKPLPNKMSTQIFQKVRQLDDRLDRYYNLEGVCYIRKAYNDKYYSARRLKTDAAAVLALYMSLGML